MKSCWPFFWLRASISWLAVALALISLLGPAATGGLPRPGLRAAPPSTRAKQRRRRDNKAKALEKLEKLSLAWEGVL